MKLATKIIHAGAEPDPSTGAIMTPIYQTSTYVQAAPGQHKGYEYARSQNPTRKALEDALAVIENGKYGLAFSSGVAATDAVIKLLSPGDEVIAANDMYGGTYRLFTKVFEKFGIKLLSIGFLIKPEQAVVWRGPMVSSALRQFVSDCDWGELDYLILDLPPGTGDIHLTMLQILPLTGVVMVTTPQAIALADAYKAATMFSMTPVKVPILGLVENMAYFTPAELPDNKYYIFGKDGGKNMASELNVSLLGQVPIYMGIREGGDAGIPAALDQTKPAFKAFEKIAQNVAQLVSIINSTEKTVSAE